jgi:hypothetical protein
MEVVVMTSDPVGILLAAYPAPWTAWWVRSAKRYRLIDANGGIIGHIEDKTLARGIARVINDAARQRTANAPLAGVIQLAAQAPVAAPPAPDPRKGVSTKWSELFDHLIYLLEEPDLAALRKRLFDYARVTDDLPLPDVFTSPDNEQGS